MMNVKLSKGKYISSVINQENFVCVCDKRPAKTMTSKWYRKLK